MKNPDRRNNGWAGLGIRLWLHALALPLARHPASTSASTVCAPLERCLGLAGHWGLQLVQEHWASAQEKEEPTLPACQAWHVLREDFLFVALVMVCPRLSRLPGVGFLLQKRAGGRLHALPA